MQFCLNLHIPDCSSYSVMSLLYLFYDVFYVMEGMKTKSKVPVEGQITA